MIALTLLISLAVSFGSAAVQAVGKLRARKNLNQLRADLADSRRRHRSLLTEYYLRQRYLCGQLGLEPPPVPEVLKPPTEPEEGTGKLRLWRRLLRRKPKTTLTHGSTGSAVHIVGRHSLSVATGAVWRTTSGSIMRVVQPISARLFTFAPRFLAFGGSGAAATGGSIASSTAVRFAISSFSIIGILLGPAIASWTIFSEMRKVRRARLDLRILLHQQDQELAAARVRIRRLEAQYAEAAQATPEVRELVGVGR